VVATFFTATRTAMFRPVWQTAAAAHVTIASAAMSRGRGLLASPCPFVNTLFTLEDVQARYGGCFARAMRMPADAAFDLVDILRPRLPRRGLSPLCRTALALRYLGGRRYVDICAVFGVHPATLYRSLSQTRGHGWLVNRWKGCGCRWGKTGQWVRGDEGTRVVCRTGWCGRRRSRRQKWRLHVHKLVCNETI